MSSQVVTWGLSMIAAVVVPRALGAELVGRLHLANSLWAIGLVVTAFGMNLSIVKGVARDKGRVGPLIGTSIATRFLIYIPVAIVLFAYALGTGQSRQFMIVMAIVGVGTIAQMLIGSISAILKGLDTMGVMSVALIVGRMIFVFGAVALLALGFGIYAVATIAVVGGITTFIIQWFALSRTRREIGGTGSIGTSVASVKGLLAESAPYFWMTLFIVVYIQVDAIIISLVVENDEVLGWYSVYDRLGGTLMFVPTVFMAAVYPTLSRLYGAESDASNDQGSEQRPEISADSLQTAPIGDETEAAATTADPSRYNRLTQKTFQVMLLISVPIGFGFSAVSRQLAELLFGEEFSNAGPVMAVGGVVLSLTYLTTVLGLFLITMDRQRQWTWVIGLGAFLTIPLDLVLVPFFQAQFDNGAIGGAVAYFITESIILMGAIYLLPRGALGPSSLFYVARVVAAGLVMVAFVYPLRQLPIIVPVVVGAVSYVVTVAALRLVAPEDRAMAISFLPGALGRKIRS